MDPNVTLKEFRRLCALGDYELAAAYMRDLDDWLSRGGFLPADWAPKSSK
jgi:hypothetical protein